MSWYHKVGKKEIYHKDELIEIQYGIVEYYPDLDAYTDFIEPIGLRQEDDSEEEALDDLIWSLERMLEAAYAAKDNKDFVEF